MCYISLTCDNLQLWCHIIYMWLQTTMLSYHLHVTTYSYGVISLTCDNLQLWCDKTYMWQPTAMVSYHWPVTTHSYDTIPLTCDYKQLWCHIAYMSYLLLPQLYREQLYYVLRLLTQINIYFHQSVMGC